MRGKKLVGLILTFVMILTSLPASAVLIGTEDQNYTVALPENLKSLFKPDLSQNKTLTTDDDAALHMMSVSTETGSVEVKDGKIISAPNADVAGATGFRMWVNGDKSVINNKPVAVSFDFQKDSGLGAELRIVSKINSAESVGLVFMEDGSLYARCSEVPNTAHSSKWTQVYAPVNAVDNPVRITMMMNPAENLGSAWMTYNESGVEKNVLLFSGAYPRAATSTDFWGVYCYTESKKAGSTFEISNIEFFEAEPTNIDKVNYAVKSIIAADEANGGKTVIYDDMDLPASYGDIALSYSLEPTTSASIENGKLVIKEVNINENIAITLNVTASLGDFEMTLQKNIELAIDKSVNSPTAPAEEDCIYYEDFDDCASIADADGLVVGDNEINVPTIENGKIKVAPTAASVNNRDGVGIYFDAGKATLPTNRKIAIEFDLENPTDDQIMINLTQTQIARQGAALDFTAGYLSARNGNTAVSLTSGLSRKNNVVIVIYGQTYDIYLNGVEVAKGFSFRHTSYVYAIAQLEMFFGDANAVGGYAYIDNVKVYYDEDRKWLDPVDVEAPLQTTSDFELQQTSGKNTIAWESSNSDVIEIKDGKALVKASATKGYDVVLTASTQIKGVKYFKTFNVNVPANEVPPRVGDYIYNEDFDDCKSTEDADGFIGSDNDVNLPVIENGKLKLSPVAESVGMRDGACVFFYENKASLPTDKKIAIEFDIENPTDDQVMVNLTHNGSVARQGVSLDFSAGYLSARNGNTAVQLAEGLARKNKVVVVIYGQQYDVYLNGTSLAKGFSFRHTAYVNAIAQLEMFFGDANSVGGYAYIDNIKVYEVGLSVVEKVDNDFAVLESEGFAAISSQPSTDVYEAFEFEVTEGNTVKFSSEKGFVNEDGTLNLPTFAQNDVVTVTISNGYYEKSKSFEYVNAGACYIGELDKESSVWEGSEYYAVFPAYMRTNDSLDVMLAVAAYEGNKLIAINFNSQTINPESKNADENYIYESVDVGFEQREGTVYAKAFVLAQNLKPLIKAEAKNK